MKIKKGYIIAAVVCFIIAIVILAIGYYKGSGEEKTISDNDNLNDSLPEKDITELSNDEFIKLPIDIALQKIRAKQKQSKINNSRLNELSELIEEAKKEIPEAEIVNEKENQQAELYNSPEIDEIEKQISEEEKELILKEAKEKEAEAQAQAEKEAAEATEEAVTTAIVMNPADVEKIGKIKNCRACGIVMPFEPRTKIICDECKKKAIDLKLSQKEYIKKINTNETTSVQN